MNCKKRLTILVTTVDVVGRINACTGVTGGLLKRGHRVVFLTEESFQGRLSALGFEEYVYRMEMDGGTEPAATTTNKTSQSQSESKQQQKDCSKNAVAKPGEKVASGMFINRIIGPYHPKEKFQNLLNLFVLSASAGRRIVKSNHYIKEAIEAVKPDLIWVDNTYLAPAIFYSGIPYLNNISTTPLYCVFDETLTVPPGGSGYPANGDKSDWASFNEVRREFFYSSTFNNYLEEMGYQRYPADIRTPETNCLLTVYGWPKELSFPLIEQKDKWFNLESFNKNESQEVVNLSDIAGEQFAREETLDGTWSGRLIFLSMGTMASTDLTLMKRLIEVLSRTPHKYIVSKGPRHEEITLPRNMWGQRYVPQTRILPLVHLVICHGGNNTVCEAFAQGKPMIVGPIFADQYDNAQRIEETGFGRRFDPYSFEDSQLTEAVEELLADGELQQRLAVASQRIRSTKKHEELYELIENLMLKAEGEKEKTEV